MRALIIETPKNFRRLLVQSHKKILAGAWEHMGLEPTYPKTTAEVLTLVAAFGYDCTDRHLVHAFKTGKLEKPAIFGLALAWKADDVQRLLLYLDSARRWLPGRHDNRKSKRELARDRKILEHGARMLDYLQTLSEDELADRLKAAKDDSMADSISIALKLKKAGA